MTRCKIRGPGCRVQPCEPHHPKGDLNLSGVAMTAPDVTAFAVCRPCHDAIQEYRPADWRSTQRRAIIEQWIEAFQDGMLERADGGIF